jgi:hypothetical protein
MYKITILVVDLCLTYAEDVSEISYEENNYLRERKLYIVPALNAAHIAHTRPEQKLKSSYVKNHTITQHTLAIIHQT